MPSALRKDSLLRRSPFIWGVILKINGVKMLKYLFFIFLFTVTTQVIAGPNYQGGKIKNLTAVTSGIMISLDSGLPDNCEGTPYGWMLIKQEYAAITSVVLAAWASGNKSGTVYTLGRENGTGYCLITQFDPVN